MEGSLSWSGSAWTTVPGRCVEDERDKGCLWVGDVLAENRTEKTCSDFMWKTLVLWARL